MKEIWRLFLLLILIAMFATPVSASELDKKMDDLTAQISADIISNGQTTIAVMEFSDIQGCRSALGKFIAEELTTRLFKTRKFVVVERELLNKVLQEHQLNLAGFIEPNSAQELGRLLGATAIVTGTITDLGKTIKINARLIATETGAIFSVAAVEITKNEALEKLAGEQISEAESTGVGSTTNDETTVNSAASVISPQISPTSVEETSPWLAWFSHCNISFNFPAMNQTMVEMSDSNYTLSFIDGFGDVYNFKVKQDAFAKAIPYGIVNIRIPFYYRDRANVNYAVGLQSVQRTFRLDDDSNQIISNGGQIYLSWSVFEKISLIGAVGFNYYQVSLDAGEIQAAFPGDPGFYTNGKFYPPGTQAYINGASDLELSCYIGMKYHLRSWLYLEVGFAYFPGGVIDSFDLQFDEVSIPIDSSPINISSDAVFSIGIGFGL
ncbi:MAG TPA: FlgO family outer membrane protein [Bacillota bacterium]|nr:FlgO family outer membrane protein [Bacillota bacterium]